MTASADDDGDEVARVWVRTVPAADGSGYLLSVEFDSDTARALDGGEAYAYAEAVVAAAARAEFDAAVWVQLTGRLQMTPQEAAVMMREWRAGLPDLDQTPTAPLRLDPGVAPRGAPFLTVWISGELAGQWTVTEARHHALAVLEGHANADLDSQFARFLTEAVGLDAERAGAVLAGLAPIRERLPE